MKKWFAVLVGLLILLMVCMAFNVYKAHTASVRYEGEGFETPEDAVLHYLEGLKNLDLGMMLEAFAWETAAERCSFEKYIARIGVFSLVTTPAFPSGNPLFNSLNVESFRNRETTMIKNAFIEMLLKHLPEYESGHPLRVEDADLLAASFNTERLNDLANMGTPVFVEPEYIFGSKYNSDKVVQLRERAWAPWGGDEMVDVIAIFTVGNEQYAVMPSVVRYGDRWYISTLQGYASMMLGVSQFEAAFFPLDMYVSE